MPSVHLIPGAASVPPLSLALFYKGKRLPNRAIRCAIYATSVVYHVNCRLSTVSKICIQDLYTIRIQKVCNLALFSTACMAFCPILRPALLPCRDAALPPPGYLPRRFSPCRFRLRRGDARGEAPCIRKLKSPLPAGKSALRARAGGWGQGSLSFPFGKGGRSKAKGRVGRRQNR